MVKYIKKMRLVSALVPFLAVAPLSAQTLSGITHDASAPFYGLPSGLVQAGPNIAQRASTTTMIDVNFSWVTPFETPTLGGPNFVTHRIEETNTIAAGDAASRFGGSISGLVAGVNYIFNLQVGSSTFGSPPICPAVGFEVDGVKQGITTSSISQWYDLSIPFTASASSVSFVSHGDGPAGTGSYCYAAFSFGSDAVVALDSDGDGETDDLDPERYNPCVDSSGAGTSAYAQANCVDLQLVKTGGTQQGSCNVGELEWFLTASNNGPADATDVLVNDYPIAGINGTASVISTSCTGLPCTIPSLAVGASEVITVCTN